MSVSRQTRLRRYLQRDCGEALVELLDGRNGSLKTELSALTAARGEAEALPFRGVVEELRNRCCKGIRVAGRHEEPLLPVGEDRGNPADAGRDDRPARGHPLEH